MAKKLVAVLFGGRSVEHEISVLSAIQAMDALDPQQYQVIPVYIAHSGRWYTGEALRKRDFYKKLPAALEGVQEVILLPQPGSAGLLKRGARSLFSRGDEHIAVDVFLPVFHGQYGEDGAIQGLLEMAEKPYAGPQLLMAAIAMNKYICKSLLEKHGIPVLPSATVTRADALRDIQAACRQVQDNPALAAFPLFVKPVNLGSSVGVSKAADAQALASGLMQVFQYDTEAIVEPCVTRLMEINVSVLEREGEPEVSVVEIPVSSGEFLSYEDKYLREGKGKKGGEKKSEGMASLTRVIDPQDLDSGYREQVRSYAARAYRVLGASGVVRFDFMVDLDKGELYFNELNSIPGSLSFYLWERSQPPLVLSDVLDRVIAGAERRHIEKRQLKRDFGFKALK